jgi:hypothetical protein
MYDGQLGQLMQSVSFSVVIAVQLREPGANTCPMA